MTITDYLLDSALILIVLRQIKERRMDHKFVLMPLIIVAVVARSYLHSIPTAGNDLILIGTFAAIGVAFGLGSALTTKVRHDGGAHALARATVTSAGLWVLSMSLRMAFQIYANHGGADRIAQFSYNHHITSSNAWTAALVLMAVAEVVARTGTLVLRDRMGTTRRPALVAA